MIVLLFVTLALLVISLTTLLNVFLFPRLRPRTVHTAPFVSVMIPARNEAAVIGETVQRLLAQDYPHYELLLLDDHSDDGTGDLARAAAQAAGSAERLTVLQGKPLPPGWMGKNWACHQMQEAARGEILLFTDADVRWSPEGLRALVSEFERTQADLYTIWPTQQTLSWAERLCVPLMALVIIGYLPIIGTHYIPLSAFGAANGQCMAWRRRAYDALGGHYAVRDNVLEDVTLARMVKGRGGRLRMADGNQLVSCRMYTGWASVRDGFAKNILAGYGSVAALLLATVFHLAVFILPLVWLITGAFGGWWPLALIVLGVLVRAVTAAFTHQRVLDALLLPLSVLLMTRIAVQALWWHYRYGGPKWKGRVITARTRKSMTHG
ncbi:MAG: hydroxychlorobactene glucosyltransferase CruC [Anaerolineae bacterium]